MKTYYGNACFTYKFQICNTRWQYTNVIVKYILLLSFEYALLDGIVNTVHVPVRFTYDYLATETLQPKQQLFNLTQNGNTSV